MYARLIRWPFPILGIVSGGSAIRRQAMALGPRWSFAAAFACVVIAQEVAHRRREARRKGAFDWSALEEHNRIIPSLVDFGRLSPIAHTEPLAAHEFPDATP
jgi:hypothetical protein